MTDTSLCVGGDALLQLLKNYSRTYNMKKAITVGVVGYPNVGKSSLVNSLKRSRAVGVSSTPGHTKVLQEVQLDSKVKLIDSPGVIFDEARDTDGKVTSESLLLRNCISADSMTDPVPAATAIVSRCRVEQLMELYSVAQYRSRRVPLATSRTQGKLLKGGCQTARARQNPRSRLEHRKGSILHSAAGNREEGRCNYLGQIFSRVPAGRGICCER